MAPNGVTAPGRTPHTSSQEFGGAEGDAPLRADFLVHALEVDDRLLAEDEQEQLALLVLDEQVLGVSAGNVAAQRPRILDRMERRMLDGFGLDSEGGEIGDEVFRRGRHGALGTGSGAW